MAEKVQVVSRLRPPLRPNSPLSVVPVDEQRLCVANRRVYDVDRVYGTNDSTEYIFYDRVAALVDRFLTGYNATVLAYGQTGSGKTFTMSGLMPLILRYTVERMGGHTKNLSFQCVEVYGEVLRDLLTSDPAGSAKHLHIHEVDSSANNRNGTANNLNANNCGASVVVVGAARVKARNFEEIQEIIDYSSKMRATGATQMNENSSRSHSIFTIFNHEQQSKLNLVDLAGSERNKKTHNVGQRFRESCAINGGLLALGNVIRALSRNSFSHPEAPQHVPYRSSKLTRLLQDSLGGNSTTLLIACVSADADNTGETVRTMQYSALAARILNEPFLRFEGPAAASLVEVEDDEKRQDEHECQRNDNSAAAGGSTEVIRLRKRVAGLEEHLQRCCEELKNDEVAFAQQIKYTKMLLQENEQLKQRISSLEGFVPSPSMTPPATAAAAAAAREMEINSARLRGRTALWQQLHKHRRGSPEAVQQKLSGQEPLASHRLRSPLMDACGFTPINEYSGQEYSWEGEKTVISTQSQQQQHLFGTNPALHSTAWNEPAKVVELPENISNINHINDSGSLYYESEKHVTGREEQLNLLAKEALYYQNSNSELRRRLRAVMALYEAQQQEAAMLRHEVEQIRELIDGRCQV
ncbi:kinesin, putative [Trypanosoma brucei gambiense DAL972]|uniref:Kinesin-like protein n=1 Tax=Trypanosoma brucei gambiense (strain MHOM/CI/86/DAL972) TaxID=679716 RepID=C9ZTM7_TRYB9|nr:kinesin, putative [Trypanosoma brucei gambiense DAL972]CBH12762.1 kinesin, putative [Trypanosoma brucei gambiense DAL972]|eukprot:XP_011775042.1 kinesin, putative [Trypanosoma brucei gambiense DAL972]